MNMKRDRECADFQNFTVYAKRLFFANGIHHHYSEDKFFPECPEAEYFQSLMEAVGDGEQATELLEVIYSPDIYPQRRSTSKTGDIVELSAVNFYDGVTREEVDKYYNSMMDPNDKTPISYGLNTKVVKEDGKVVEKPWKRRRNLRSGSGEDLRRTGEGRRGGRDRSSERGDRKACGVLQDRRFEDLG